MQRAKVFMTGNSQAVRLPKELRFDVDEVEIAREGDRVVLRKPLRTMNDLIDAMDAAAAPVPDFPFPDRTPMDRLHYLFEDWREDKFAAAPPKSRASSSRARATPAKTRAAA